jgi:hypothetical protein
MKYLLLIATLAASFAASPVSAQTNDCCCCKGKKCNTSCYKK